MILNHRNHLKNYGSTIKDIYNSIENVSLNIDFSENLSVSVKLVPQSTSRFLCTQVLSKPYSITTYTFPMI